MYIPGVCPQAHVYWRQMLSNVAVGTGTFDPHRLPRVGSIIRAAPATCINIKPNVTGLYISMIKMRPSYLRHEISVPVRRRHHKILQGPDIARLSVEMFVLLGIVLKFYSISIKTLMRFSFESFCSWSQLTSDHIYIAERIYAIVSTKQIISMNVWQTYTNCVGAILQ